MTKATDLIAVERHRQIDREGYDPEHDALHTDQVLIYAALCYGHQALEEPDSTRMDVPDTWPWRDEDWKPTGDVVRDLTKAAALIAAEIDRLLDLQEHR